MSLLVCGINHKTTPLALREKLAINPDQQSVLLKELIAQPAINEAVILSTCNRTEIYLAASTPVNAIEWLATQRINTQTNAINSYCLQEVDAVKHLMRVASGLDSMILGEPEILGQVKQAYLFAQEMGSVGQTLQNLFPSVFAVSKQIRNETHIGVHPVSFAYAIVQLAERIFSDISNCQALLIGTGTTMELVATYLKERGIQQSIVASRQFEHAQQFAQQYQAKAITLEDLPNYLAQVDLVISATHSPLPLIGKGLIERIIKQRKHRPIFIADLAVPRDIEPEVNQLEDVYLYNIDDLQTIITKNLKNREQAAIQAEAMVTTQALHYMQKLRVTQAGHMIKKFRQQYETIRDQEIKKALTHFQNHKNISESLHQLANNLTQKMLHVPTKKLRQAAYDERLDHFLAIQNLFDIE